MFCISWKLGWPYWFLLTKRKEWTFSPRLSYVLEAVTAAAALAAVHAQPPPAERPADLCGGGEAPRGCQLLPRPSGEAATSARLDPSAGWHCTPSSLRPGEPGGERTQVVGGSPPPRQPGERKRQPLASFHAPAYTPGRGPRANGRQHPATLAPSPAPGPELPVWVRDTRKKAPELTSRRDSRSRRRWGRGAGLHSSAARAVESPAARHFAGGGHSRSLQPLGSQSETSTCITSTQITKQFEHLPEPPTLHPMLSSKY